MKFTLEIDCDNDAFNNTDDRDSEVIGLVRVVAEEMERGTRAGTMMDANGNKVGSWQFHDKAPPVQPTPPKSSPWGLIDQSHQIAPGIWRVYTASHGGFWLSPDRQDAIPVGIEPFTGDRAWWEEDSDWAYVALTFPVEFCQDRDEPKAKILDEARAAVAAFHSERLELFEATP